MWPLFSGLSAVGVAADASIIIAKDHSRHRPRISSGGRSSRSGSEARCRPISITSSTTLSTATPLFSLKTFAKRVDDSFSECFSSSLREGSRELVSVSIFDAEWQMHLGS